jgi:hypothetical protein
MIYESNWLRRVRKLSRVLKIHSLAKRNQPTFGRGTLPFRPADRPCSTRVLIRASYVLMFSYLATRIPYSVAA